MKNKMMCGVAAFMAALASALLAVVPLAPLSAADFDVRTFGAKGDGATMNTGALQSAIDAAAAKGGGRVVFADGTYLSGALIMKSGVELHIDRTAKLLASPEIADFPDFPDRHVVRENLPRQRSAAFIFADEAERIAITGGGTIDCNGMHHIREISDPGQRTWNYARVHEMTNSLPRVVFFAGCRDVVIRDVTMTGQPAGWSYWIHDCDRVQISSLKILANVRYPNNDGIHVNCSRDVTISDCIIETGDDSIIVRANSRSLKDNKPCERVVVNNCTLRSWSSGIRIGWTNDGTIRDCTFSNIVMYDTRNGVSIALPKRRYEPGRTDFGREATVVENLTFSNIVMDGIYDRPLSVSIAPESSGTKAAAVRDVHFSGVRANSIRLPMLSGRTDCPIQRFTFTDCTFRRILDPAYPQFTHRKLAEGKMKDNRDLVLLHTEGLRLDNTVFDAP